MTDEPAKPRPARTLSGLPRRAGRALVDGQPPLTLGDFTTSPRVVYITALAVVVGLISTVVAWALLHLINIFTWIFFFGRLDADKVDLRDADKSVFFFLAPVIGGLIIGLMAKYGSDRIRGHGIPEAIEAILIGGSKVQPRVAILKPVSSAISIGSGGPFGAEGPIILTGGAFGSLFGQVLHISSIERRTLLVAGAAAGMSATFAAPVAAVLLAVELLLFEWKPRSFIPVAFASATAAVARRTMLDPGPLFPVGAIEPELDTTGFLACLVVGLSAGLVSIALTAAVYGAEDFFHRLPIHWMWWPAIGGVAIGGGGLLFPDALGVGYPVIRDLLSGDDGWSLIAGVLLVKSLIWAISLGSGTSGGVLAPLLMIGASMGALEGHFLPAEGQGFWPMIAMGAVMGGTMRSPLTATVFILELTHNVDSLLPVLVAVVVAHGTTVLFLRRSILTEKVSRRGLHLGREYAPDPMETVLVRAVMSRAPQALRASASPADLAASPSSVLDPLYPIVDDDGRLLAVITGRHLRTLLELPPEEASACRFGDLALSAPVVARPGESLRAVADRMAVSGRTRLPVVDESGQLAGMVSLRNVLGVRAMNLEAEVKRDRVLRFRRTMRAPAQPSKLAHQ